MQQRLIIAGLKLVSDDKQAVRVFADVLDDVAAGKAIERSLGDDLPPVLVLTREGDDGLPWAVPLFEGRAQGEEILDGPRYAARNHHGPCVSADFLSGQYLLVEVFDNN